MRRKLASAVIVICIIAAAMFVIVKVRTPGIVSDASEQDVQEFDSNPVICVNYAGTYLSINKDGIVCGNSSQQASGVPLATGLEFTNLAYGCEAEMEKPSSLEYVIKAALSFENHEIYVDTINYNNRTITATVNNLRIELGKDENTETKINDLSDFIDKVINLSGTLYMQNENADNYGYTFRED